MILCIETSTDVCSVGLATGGEVVALRESAERDHAGRAAVFAREVLAEAGVSPGQLAAVAVSKGPGSYTGLRIGVSLAKGLCYGLGIPLIGVGSLESLVEAVCSFGFAEAAVSPAGRAGGDEKIFIPMIDARRMEVYTRVFDGAGRALTAVEAKVIDGDSFAGQRSEAERRGGEVYIFGDGAAKCRQALPWAKFIDVRASAKGMARLAENALSEGRTEDTAYFEPFYLKDFVTNDLRRK